MSSSFLVAISRWQPMASRVTMTRETSNAPFDDGGDQDSDHCNRVAVSGRLHDRQSWGEADGRCGARGNRWVRARVHGQKRQARDRGHGGENHGGVVSRRLTSARPTPRVHAVERDRAMARRPVPRSGRRPARPCLGLLERNESHDRAMDSLWRDCGRWASRFLSVSSLD